MPPTTVRALAAWLDEKTPPLSAAIARRALSDVGLCEVPPGSNRSPRIDEYVRAAGSPLGSFWCACFVAAVFREAGALTPGAGVDGSCDAWRRWAMKRGRWSQQPVVGAAVVYGKVTDGVVDANHIGVVVRVDPLLLAVEGNTSLGGYDRNGVAVDLKQVDRARVLGYVHPLPA